MKQKPKTCAHCGEEFVPLKRNGMYCSNTCRQYSYLTRKTGEMHGVVKEVPMFDQSVPALIIEEQEEINESIVTDEPSIINQPVAIYQFKEKNNESNSFSTTQSVNWNYSGNNQQTVNKEPIKKTEKMRTEQSTNNQSTIHENIPVVEANEKTFKFIDPEITAQESEEEILLPVKNYHDTFEDEKIRQNSDMASWLELVKLNKEDKQLVYKFGQRIKPYLQTLISLNGKKVFRSTLKALHGEMCEIMNRFLPFENCPLWYPPVDFCVGNIEEEMKFFIAKLEEESIPKVELVFTDKLKAKIEVIQMMIKAYTPVTPDNWQLP